MRSCDNCYYCIHCYDEYGLCKDYCTAISEVISSPIDKKIIQVCKQYSHMEFQTNHAFYSSTNSIQHSEGGERNCDSKEKQS